jgi:predicted RecB family nuclease
MTPAPATVTDDIFTAFLKCPYKAHLKFRGVAGQVSDYERVQVRLAAEYRRAAQEALLRTHGEAGAVRDPLSLPTAIRAGATLVLDAAIGDGDTACRLDAVVRSAPRGAAPGGACAPVLFSPHERIAADDRLRLAFGSSLLARVLGTQPETGRIVHGPQFRPTRVSLPTLSGAARAAVDQIRAIRESNTPPPLLLNRHCPECEFRQSCRAAAVAKDDLSLLRGLSPKEIAGLQGRGVFTVTQYAHTFRPGRMKGGPAGKGLKYDHSLQALAVRDSTVYVAQRPTSSDAKARLYLDVEGLPDQDCYYLIGLTVEDGGTRRQLAFWADDKADEAAIWAAFLAAVGPIEDFVVFHYGSYESHFLDRMEARHGGDPGLVARLKSRSVNVLSLLYGRVYFPVHSNDLKSVAGCLGFRWSAAGASGLQAVVWRHGWAATGDEAIKQQLIAYNREDRSALAQVVDFLSSIGSESRRADDATVPRVTAVEDIEFPAGHQFCNPEYVLPEFARITKCAYFDYQRNKILFRTNPAVRRSIQRTERGERRAIKVNREIQCVSPTVCPRCGSDRMNPRKRYQRIVFDLKPSGGGLKRWVTRYTVKGYQCGDCARIASGDEYLAATTHKYGPVLCNWLVYSSVAQRQTSEALAEALKDVFAIRIPLGSLADLVERTADRYRATYDSLLATLRTGQLVHADETKARTKGSNRRHYVWAFADPQTVAYVYSPTRDGDTPRDTLAGFRGVLVSDFYAAYDSVDCPQQKCLIHLVRDLNDDLAEHPFDEELKELTGRFAGLLQAVVGTIDRYGLKKYHLHKHMKDVDAFYAAVSGTACRSETARHYHRRFLKYREKLFTFLDHDGVPWNNNNAENAIKRFVARRKQVGACLSEDGLRQYLRLLSIYQTLRYRGLSFWQFLISGETDIEAFTAQRR